MRGIPTIATRQDLLNVCRDLEAGLAIEILAGISKKDRRRIGVSAKEIKDLQHELRRRAEADEARRDRMAAIQARLKEVGQKIAKLESEIRAKTAEIRALHADVHVAQAEHKRLVAELREEG